MVECPVCGKWLKNFFALNGHMRLKEDNYHHAYFEAHNKQTPNTDTSGIDNQLRDFGILFENLSQLVSENYMKFNKQSQILTEKITNIEFRLNQVEQFVKYKPYSTTPIVQQEVKKEIPQKKGEKNQTVEDLIIKYGSFENAIEYIDHYKLIDIVDKDPNLSSSQKMKFKDMSREKWPRR